MHNYAVAGVAVASLTIGAASGYLFAKKQLVKKYDEILEDQIARTREHYKKTYKADEYATPQDAAEALGVEVSLEEAAEAVIEYAGEDTGTMFAEQARFAEPMVEKNIFDDGDQLKINKDDRDRSKPYVVDINEFMDKPDEWQDDIQLTYFSGDNILGDDKDEPIPDYKVDEIIGRMNLLLFGASDPDQPHVLLVRNEKLKTDFEIAHSDGKFSHEVAGLMHSDEPFQRIRRNNHRDE